MTPNPQQVDELAREVLERWNECYNLSPDAMTQAGESFKRRFYVEAILDALQVRRDAVFGPGNNKVWGEGNWVRCDECPDADGWPSYHHREFHSPADEITQEAR